MAERDEITLTLPREREFQRVAQLVLGGLALRHELTIEDLEDVQLALAAVLDHGGVDADVTVAMCLEDGTLETRVGPIDLTTELDRADGDGVGLGRVLSAVVDDVAVDGDWVLLRKRVHAHG